MYKPQTILTLMIALGLAISVQAQFEFPTMSLRGAAMGGTSVALDDEMSSLSNTAALAHRHGWLLASSYRQDFHLKRTTHKWLAAAVSLTPSGTATASYHHYGSSLYNEQQTSLGYAQAITNSIALGATIDFLYSSTSDPHYDPLRALSFSLSALAALSDNMTIGTRVANPATIRLNNDNSLPTQASVGIAYSPLDFLTSTLEVEKTSQRPVVLRGGVEWLFLNHFAFRAGFATKPTVFSFGLGFRQKLYVIDLCTAVHQTMGLTSMLGGTLTF